MRLQRFLAQAGVASRRKAETLITSGVVKVNGKVVTELGTKVDPQKDQVSVEGRPVRLVAPLIEMTKAEIIRAGVELGVDYGLTHSCYDPGPTGGACGGCDACLLRRKGFAQAGVPDPTRYER